MANKYKQHSKITEAEQFLRDRRKDNKCTTHSGKRRFKSKKNALSFNMAWQFDNPNERCDMRVYRCDVCGYYFLTSQT